MKIDIGPRQTNSLLILKIIVTALFVNSLIVIVHVHQIAPSIRIRPRGCACSSADAVVRSASTRELRLCSFDRAADFRS